MKMDKKAFKIFTILSVFMISPLQVGHAQATVDDKYLLLEKSQIEKNSISGLRNVPAKLLPIPKNLSPELTEAIKAPYNSPRWYGNHAETKAEWKKIVNESTAKSLKNIPKIQSDLSVNIKPLTIGNVNAFEITPRNIENSKKDKIIVYFHGGGYVYNPGLAGSLEAMQMASEGGYRVISVDYRMPPDSPYPAALNDALTVYKELLKNYDPSKISIFGTSAGGGLTMALMLKVKAEKLPFPAAIGLGTPWMDLTADGGGDTINTLEWVDNTLISARGYISRSSILYANGESLTNPYISPIFGNYEGLPPVIIISGTRDLFLSQSVLTHRKFKQAGIEADLQLWDGMAHAQYEVYKAPESKEVFKEMSQFFTKHMK